MSIVEGRAGREPGMGFPSPLEVALPSECEGWEEFYPPHALFADDRRVFEESRFWFQDAIHYAEPYHPFDAMLAHCIVINFNHTSARRFVVPSSLGMEQRILGGYVYLSPNSVTDEDTIAARAGLFANRGAHYYEHWDELDRQWRVKVQKEIRELAALEIPQLPEVEEEALVMGRDGVASSHRLLVAYDRLLESFDRICNYHFEMMNLGYGAYLAFYEFCKAVFPDISEITIAKMVAGIDVVALRPDDELKRLAVRAIELGVGAQVRSAQDERDLTAALTVSVAGERWLADYRTAKDPWFYFSYGSGMYHHHRSWIDDPKLPIAMIGSYVARVESGEDIRRPQSGVLAERDRVTAEYRALLPEQSRATFDTQLALTRTVFPHIEDHNFFIDHWSHTVLWNKVREFGSLLSLHAFLADPEDVFFLRHDEVRAALEELRLHWSSGGAGIARGPGYWPPIVERRKTIYEALRRWAPPPALGRAPETLTEPVTIMLWGITTERVHEWMRGWGNAAETIRGIPAAPGVVEGVARVIFDVAQLIDIQDGEILVAPFTSTSWTPTFGRIAGVVTDTGGIMCHTAIVAREYRLPAVLGTGSATKRIATGDKVRVDADNGIVTVLNS